MNSLVRFFAATDLRNGHDGLRALASRNKVDVKNLGQGEFVAFMNRKQTAVKMYTGGNIIAHVRLDKGRIDNRTIAHMPKYFNGTEINYNNAVKAMIKKEFPKWFGGKTRNEGE